MMKTLMQLIKQEQMMDYNHNLKLEKDKIDKEDILKDIID